MMTLQGGQDLVEYVLLIALLGMGVVAVTKSLAIVLTTALTNIANQLLADT
jgi:Flp pilus assembly pilin Flp